MIICCIILGRSLNFSGPPPSSIHQKREPHGIESALKVLLFTLRTMREVEKHPYASRQQAAQAEPAHAPFHRPHLEFWHPCKALGVHVGASLLALPGALTVFAVVPALQMWTLRLREGQLAQVRTARMRWSGDSGLVFGDRSYLKLSFLSTQSTILPWDGHKI